MSNVSDQRLVEILNRVSPPDIGWQAGLPTVDIHAIVLELQSLRAENERLRKERDAALDNDWVAAPAYAAKVEACRQFRDRATTAEAKLDEAAKVLAPFAEQAARYDPPDNDSGNVAWNSPFHIGDLRAARSFLANLKGAE